tara:strand:+ start:25553 stop:25828 length:276 start_codon:yes stop_codon:yes gene_type:complete
MIETKEQLIKFLEDKTMVHWYDGDVQVYQTYVDNKKASKCLDEKRRTHDKASGLFAFTALSDDESIWKCAEILLKDAYHPMINNKKIFKYH